MMIMIRSYRVGLAFAVFLGGWHMLWSILVAAGAAQPVLDFIFRLHMIAPPFTVTGFSLGAAAGLVLVTAGIGYAMGWAGGFLWNRCVVRGT